MQQSRDLFLLATLAYRQGKPSDAGQLFAAAMSQPDTDQFLDLLNEDLTVTASSLLSTSRSIETSLEQAVASFTEALSADAEDETVIGLPRHEGDDDENSEDLDDIGDNHEGCTSDDQASDMPGLPLIPSSLSKVAGSPSTKIILSGNLRSPVGLK
jgi:hypothetical protein